MMCIHLHICMNTYMYECIDIFIYIYIYACKHIYYTFVCRHMFCASIIARRHIGGDTPPKKNQHGHQKIPKSVGPAGFSSSKPSTIWVQSLVSWKCIVVLHPKVGRGDIQMIGTHFKEAQPSPSNATPPNSPQREFVNSVWVFG